MPGSEYPPLEYVARSKVAVKPHAMDPATDYENADQEMTSRSPQDQYLYGEYNKTLWHILHDALKDHPSYTSIRYFGRTQNGHQLWIATSTTKRQGINFAVEVQLVHPHY